MKTLRADLSVSIESLSTITLPGFTVTAEAYELGIEVHARAAGNPLGTEQSVFVAYDRTLCWCGEPDAGPELWDALR